jgi:hypothetical protein
MPISNNQDLLKEKRRIQEEWERAQKKREPGNYLKKHVLLELLQDDTKNRQKDFHNP